MSLNSLTFTGALALGPAVGGVVLATSPDAVWRGGALVAAVLGAGFLLSGARIPEPLAATASNAPGDGPDLVAVREGRSTVRRERELPHAVGALDPLDPQRRRKRRRAVTQRGDEQRQHRKERML
jgi:MFS family permease